MRRFITVVSGLPRSGTSLMMQMLAAGGMPVLTDNARPPDEDNPRGYLEFEPVKRSAADVSWVSAAAGKAVKIVYALLRHLPSSFEYRVILMHRDIGEVVASQQAMLEHSGNTGADLPPEALQKLFERELRETQTWLSEQANCKTLPISYAECIDHPYGTAIAVADFLKPAGLDLVRMGGAVDAALYRQRRSTGPA